MRALKGAIPRGLQDHRTAEGRAFTEYTRAMQARLNLGKEARPSLRECGLLTIELARLSLEIEAVRLKPNGKKDCRRLKREQRVARGQGLASRRIGQARQLLRKLLVGMIRFDPKLVDGQRVYEFSGMATLEKILAGTVLINSVGVPNGIRTRVAGLKGRRPRPG